MEQQLMEQYDSFVGRQGDKVRGNRINPMAQSPPLDAGGYSARGGPTRTP